MAPIACNNGGPPPPPPRGRRGSLSDNDPIEDQDSSDEDENAEISEDESDEEEIEIPPDPIHEALMADLRRENEDLLRIVAEQDVVLAEMAERTRQIQEATAQRQQDLDELRAARAVREEEARKKAEEDKQGNGEGCQPPETGKRDDDDDKEGPNPVPI